MVSKIAYFCINGVKYVVFKFSSSLVRLRGIVSLIGMTRGRRLARFGCHISFIFSANYIVAYRPVAKRWLYKQRPFLGNGSVNTFLLLGNRLLIMQQSDSREAVKRKPERVKLKNLQCSKPLPRNGWWHSKLEKGLAGAVVICELWRLALTL
jgi:hypothetical protein